jgi:hypothetical protein
LILLGHFGREKVLGVQSILTLSSDAPRGEEMMGAAEHASADQTGFLREPGIEQLSRTLRVRAMEVRRRSNASLFDQSQLAAWLGEDRHLVEEALEFMVAKGWAVKFGAPDAWLIR